MQDTQIHVALECRKQNNGIGKHVVHMYIKVVVLVALQHVQVVVVDIIKAHVINGAAKKQEVE